MWGMDISGLRTLSDSEVEAFRVAGAMTEHPHEFVWLELFKTIFPFQDKMKVNKETDKMERVPHSKTSLTNLAKQGALKWGPESIPADELMDAEITNQDFVVLSCGKKKREMVFFV